MTILTMLTISDHVTDADAAHAPGAWSVRESEEREPHARTTE